MLAAAAVAPARAQIVETLDPDLAIPLGAFRLYPFARVTFEHTTNMFWEPDVGTGGPQSGQIRTLVPGFVLEMPFSRSRTQVGYALQLRDHAGIERPSGVDERSLNHFVKLDSDLRFASGLRVHLYDEWQRGVLEASVYDAGANEVTFSGEEFRRGFAELEVAHERENWHRYAVAARRVEQDVLRSPGATPSGLFDVNEFEVRAIAERALATNTVAVVQVQRSDALLVNASQSCPGFVSAWVDQEEIGGRLGLRLRRPRATMLEGLVGWSRLQGTECGEDLGATNSVVGSLQVQRELSRRADVSVRVAREIYPSLYGGEGYVSDHLLLRATRTGAGRLGWGAALGYYRNEYAGVGRSDDSVAGEGWIGYRFGRWLEWRLTVRGNTRSSSFGPSAEYDVLRVGTTVSFGGV